jgi:bilirubin oxidase
LNENLELTRYLGLFAHPVRGSTLALAMGERYEVIVDFSGSEGKNFTLKNARNVVGSIDFA